MIPKINSTKTLTKYSRQMWLVRLCVVFAFSLVGMGVMTAHVHKVDAAMSFTPKVDYNITGTTPVSVTTGDFNQDGKLDLVTANAYSADISIRLGVGNGTFNPASNFGTTLIGPTSVTAGDFDKDGSLDLAVAIRDGGVSILRGKGDGTFFAAVYYSTGNDRTGQYGLAVADFNGDTRLDLVVTNLTDNTVTILLGTGAGTFPTHTIYPADIGATIVVTGDFDQDGKVDLAVTNQSVHTVSVLRGKGDGTFFAKIDYLVGSFPYSVTTGDFNADGKLDLATANNSSVSILIGVGNGTFITPAPAYVGGVGPFSITAGDFNNDSKTDLALTGSPNRVVSILLGSGTGTFASPICYGVGYAPVSINTGDFNGDGRIDLAVANSDSSNSNSVSVLLYKEASARAITAFTIPSQVGTTTIDQCAHTIILTMPGGTNVTALVPTIVQNGASVSPASGAPGDFTTPKTYTVTAADGSTQAYVVTVIVDQISDCGVRINDGAQITHFACQPATATTSKLHVNKNGVIYSILLVLPTDPNASKVRINTSEGIRALKKYVVAANTPPVAVNDTYSVNEDNTLTVAVPGVLGNDTDAENNPLTASKLTNPASGTITAFNANGSFTYVPTANFNGSVSFTYKANDGTADSNVATVTINIAAVNDPPVANNNAYTTPFNTNLVVTARGVLTDDTDVETPSTSLTSDRTGATNPTKGTITAFGTDGSFTYAPTGGSVGNDSFTYRACDGTTCGNYATVFITISPPPCAGPPTISAVANQVVNLLSTTVVPITVTPAANCTVDSLTFEQNQPTFTHIVQAGPTGWEMHIEPPVSTALGTYSNIRLQSTSASFTGLSNFFSIQVVASCPDTVCNGTETCTTCSQDCGQCPRVHRYTSAMVWIADHQTIQSAIVAAANDNIIIVDPGNFVEPIDYLGKRLKIKSTDPTDPAIVQTTIISASDAANWYTVVKPTVTFNSNVCGANCSLEGFTIRHGSLSGIRIKNGASPTINNNIIKDNVDYWVSGQTWDYYAGGGIFVGDLSMPTIKSNTITNNSAHIGGGIYMGGGGGTIGGPAAGDGNVIQTNGVDSGGSGGGIYLSGPGTIRNNTITGNSAAGYSTGLGGGLYIKSAGAGVNIQSNIISSNTAADGAGIYNERGATMTGNTISSNTSNYDGGGVYCGGLGTCALSGNTITLNNAQDNGGGIDCENNCVITNTNTVSSNRAGFGAGIYANGTITISGNTITTNTTTGIAASKGAGIAAPAGSVTGTISSNAITNNSAAGGGGGIYNVAGSLIVSGNSITGNYGGAGGGGISMGTGTIGGPLATDGNTIQSNSSISGSGGGLSIGNFAVVKNNTIQSNTAPAGGGIYYYGWHGAKIEKNTIAKNTASSGNGGGILMHHDIYTNYWEVMEIISNTIFGNTAGSGAGGGIYRQDNNITSLSDSNIIWGNTASSDAGIRSGGTFGLTVNYSDIQGGVWAGTLNISSDPLFVNAAANDYHLTAASPCKDAGNPAYGVGTDMGRFPYP